MTDLFISVLNMSITASYVILAVLVVRFFLKNMPKKYSYLLWISSAKLNMIIMDIEDLKEVLLEL